MDLQGMHIELKNGDAKRLSGHLVAYVRVTESEENKSNSEEPASPITNMVRNGILAVQGNYVGQRNIRDFFRDEFGISLEKGIQEVIDQAKDSGGLEGALDPEQVKERLLSMKNADFIPIPAKVAFFSSEAELMASKSDVYFLGTFSVLSHAHLCVNSFPILYQAYFREQEHREVEVEIAALLNTIENPNKSEGIDFTAGAQSHESFSGNGIPTLQNFAGDAKDYLLKQLIPTMIYRLDDKVEYKQAVEHFKRFMGDFAYPDDMEAILALIESTPKHDARTLRKLELLVAKIEALQKEDFEALERIRSDLKALDKE